jgi:penicillin V acylase-like amidase (Ntn superfamily)
MLDGLHQKTSWGARAFILPEGFTAERRFLRGQIL